MPRGGGGVRDLKPDQASDRAPSSVVPRRLSSSARFSIGSGGDTQTEVQLDVNTAAVR